MRLGQATNGKGLGADRLDQFCFIVGITDGRRRPMERLVKIRAVRFAVPVEAALTIAKPQAPKQSPGRRALIDGLHGITHLIGFYEAKFTDDVGFLFIHQFCVVADLVGNRFGIA